MSEAVGGLTSTLPPRAFRRLRWPLVALVVLVGGTSAAVSWRQGVRSADRDNDAVAQEAVDLITRTVALAEAGLAGAGGIVPADGPISMMTFEAYAADVVTSSSLQALALEPVVPEAGRAAFEARLGRPIIDRENGTAIPAPSRPVHFPVQSIVPLTDANRVLVGFDIAGDPIRAAAADRARDTGKVVFSQPVASQPSGTTSFFVIKPLYRPGASLGSVEARRSGLVGFVSSAYTSRLFAEALRASLPRGTDVELRDGDTVLAQLGHGAGNDVRRTDAGDREWTIRVDGPASPDHGVAVALAALTIAIAGGLVILISRGARHDRDLRRSATLIARTADLAQALAGAQTVDEIEGVIRDTVPEVLGASVAGMAYVDREDNTLVIRHPDTVALEMGSRYRRVPLDAVLPLCEVVRTGEMLVLPDLEAWREHAAPEVVADVEKVGLVGTVVLPIESTSGRVIATLTVAWPGTIDLEEIQMATVATISEICEYALQRAMATDDAARRAAELASLAEHLASAITTEDVGRVATSLGRVPVEAAATSMGLIVGDRLVIHHGETVPDHYRTNVAAPTLDTDLAVTEVARTGATYLFETQEAYGARFPGAGGPVLGGRAVLPLRRADGTTIGMIAHLWNGPREFDDALVATLTTIAELTGQAVERTRLGLLQAEDSRRTEALAHLAQGLASRTNSEAVMGFLTQGVLGPLDAFHAAVGVIERGALRRHFTPGRLVDEAADAIPSVTPIDADTPLTVAARTGETVLLANDGELRASYPHLVDAWKAVGFHATANVPLRDRQGSVIGALGVAWDHPVTFDGDLRDRLSTVAGIAGQTLERTQLVDRLRSDARRSDSLAELAEVLAAARTASDVADAVANQAARAVEATNANVAILDPATGRLRLQHSATTRDEIRARFAVLEPTDAVPHVEITRDGGTLTFPTRDSFVARYPHLEATLVETGTEAAAVTALRDSSGHRMGAVGFAWTEPKEFDASLLAGLHGVADLCSQALERAQLSDAEHRLVTTLQGSVLAPLPTAAGLACAARYLPAARSVGMGGDWYEGVQLPDGRFAVIVGDVAGHGITAVGQMAQFRSVIGTLTRLDTPIDELFPLATSVVQGEAPIATAVIVVVDVASSSLRYVAAGHPPPLLRLDDGTVVPLAGGRQRLLGVPAPIRPPGDHGFPIGTTLVCYTDGLVERRGETMDASIARLGEALAAAVATDPEALADELLATLVPDSSQTDDVVLVVITRVG